MNRKQWFQIQMLNSFKIGDLAENDSETFVISCFVTSPKCSSNSPGLRNRGMFAAFNETSYDTDFKFIKTQHPPKFHYFVSFVVNSQNKLIPRCYPHSLRIFPHRILDFERSALGFGPTGEYKPSEKRKSRRKGTRNKTKTASSWKREESDSESECENSDLEEQDKSVSIPTTTNVKTHSLFLPVDRLDHGWADQLEHGRADQLEHGCWQACSCMLEQTVHGLMNKLCWFERCWNNHDKSTAMFMHDRTCCQGIMK